METHHKYSNDLIQIMEDTTVVNNVMQRFIEPIAALQYGDESRYESMAEEMLVAINQLGDVEDNALRSRYIEKLAEIRRYFRGWKETAESYMFTVNGQGCVTSSRYMYPKEILETAKSACPPDAGDWHIDGFPHGKPIDLLEHHNLTAVFYGPATAS